MAATSLTQQRGSSSRSSAMRRRTISRLLTAGAIAAGVAAIANFVIVPVTGTFAGPFEDFAAYSGAAHAVAGGTNPYAAFSATSVVMSGFDYPPFAALLLRPLDLLSPRWEELTWLWLSLAALLGGAVITARALLPSTWPRTRIAVIAALTFPPATYNLWHGQMNLFIFLMLALALRDYLSGRRTRCGVILGLAAGVKLAPIVLLVVLARRGWWRGVAAGVATALATAGVGVAALGWPVTGRYLSTVLPVLDRDNGWIYNQTWNGVVSRLFAHSVLVPASSLPVRALATALTVATLGVLALAVRRGTRTPAERGAEFACGVVAMLLVGSIAWYPVYVHLLIALAAALGLAHERALLGRALRRGAAVTLLGIGGVAGAAIAALTMDEVVRISHSPWWWAFLQACSLPALLAAGVLALLVRALRAAVSPAAALAPSLAPPRDAHPAPQSPGACPTASSLGPSRTPA